MAYNVAMRVDTSPLSLPAAVAVMDLHMAGVGVEMSETLHDWTEAVKTAVQVAPVAMDVPTPARVEVAVPVSQSVSAPPPAPLLPRALKAEPSAVANPSDVQPIVVDRPGRVWQTGASGGVVVFVQAEHVPEGPEAHILTAMLAAVGFAHTPVAYVGFTGQVAQSALIEAAEAFAPTHVLVLGQEALAALSGTKVGVEGWHAGAKQGTLPPTLAAKPVGVTYPPALLIRQPLFKRLAWRHLVAWRAAKGF